MAAPPAYTASITLDNPEPSHGDKIIATVTTDAPASGVSMNCYQDGVFVARSDWVSKKGPTYTEDFGLYAGSWPSGAAHCVMSVRIWNSKRRRLEDIPTALEFDVKA